MVFPGDPVDMKSFSRDEIKYRVILLRIGTDTEEERTRFCREVSERYGIPLGLMTKISDRCPIVVKKDLSLQKARVLAKALKTAGASVSVEKGRVFSPVPIVLEWTGGEGDCLELTSASLQQSPGGVWRMVGRVKNVSGQALEDLWVLAQLFDSFDELLTFEESPLSLNPLPAGMISPFKVIFERDLPAGRLSISFKTASGNLLPAADKRDNREWVEVEVSPILLAKGEGSGKEGTEKVPDEGLEPEEPRTISCDGRREKEEIHSVQESVEIFPGEMDLSLQGQEGEEIETVSGENSGPSAAQERVSIEPFPAGIENESGDFRAYPWMDEFRKAIEIYHQTNPDPFISWFETLKKEERFENPFHSLLTVLIYARFNQPNPSETALENVQRVYIPSLRKDLRLEDIPPLLGTAFFTDETWTDLYARAIPKLKEVAGRILEERRWDALDLERLIRIIPHMTDRNSRWAIHFIHERIPDVTIKVSEMDVEVSEGLYRVASRLGVVNPIFDYYQGAHSAADRKIQSFARSAFPEWPGMIEEPMRRLGVEEEGGLCLPAGPLCEHCPFQTFCAKRFVDFDPSEKKGGNRS